MNQNDISKDSNWEPVLVECCSVDKANERPVAFFVRGRRWEIRETIDPWYESSMKSDAPVIDYFKVKTSEGNIFFSGMPRSQMDRYGVHRFFPRFFQFE